MSLPLTDTIVTPVLQNFGSVSLLAITVFVSHALSEAAKLWKSGALKKEAELLKQKGLVEIDIARKQAESIATASATAAVRALIADLQSGNAANALDDSLKAGLTEAENDTEKAVQDMVANASATQAPVYITTGTIVTPQSPVTVTGTVTNTITAATVVVDPVPAVTTVVDPAPVSPVPVPAVVDPAPAPAPAPAPSVVLVVEPAPITSAPV
jgi:hypothetical protein